MQVRFWKVPVSVKFRKVPEVPAPGSGKGSEVLISIFIFPDQGWVKFRKVPEVPTPGSGKGSEVLISSFFSQIRFWCSSHAG